MNTLCFPWLRQNFIPPLDGNLNYLLKSQFCKHPIPAHAATVSDIFAMFLFRRLITSWLIQSWIYQKSFHEQVATELPLMHMSLQALT